MEKWFVSAKKADFKEIGRQFDIDPVIARLIRNRDVTGAKAIQEYLRGTIQDIPGPELLKGMKEATSILKQKIREKKKIRIIGDYDIDGVTATYILIKGLERLGARADTYIPDRITDGYGIHMPLIYKALEDGVDTIVTCDNGIAASKEIGFAKEKGLTVIVTDHHEVPFIEDNGEKTYILPPADAVINTKQPGCPYPNKNLCGAVVAMKLIWALYDDSHIPETEKEEFLELAAIATVGDVMDLQGENRILVKEGLKRLPYTKNKGLQALIRVTGLEGSRISSYHIGFVLGPCINASGRLDTAARSLRLLQCEDAGEAARLAGDLKALNDSRKALTEKGKDAAIQLIENTDLKKDLILVVYLPECHESLAGIIAGRIREKYNRPVFVLTKGEKGVKGSGRSIQQYSMFEELVKCGDLLDQYGGHPMAAGLSLPEENVSLLRKRLNEQCNLKEEDLIPKVIIDVPMPISYISTKLVEQLSLLEPFGKGNTKPLFAQKNVKAINSRVIGKNHNVTKLQLMDEQGYVIEAVYFGNIPEFMDFLSARDKISVTYYPEINRYQGRETLQVIIQNYC
ncbi:single-stranded-DNA-specific exonuclease RecJ [Blautia ammoniilytica]|uniref:Single-stranded-DNA-specific exonuclease RecJ n=1 Tax=Blautia ammoniilytica TaxID=2981782 RepID=A0ABT2TW17_9FIRM|nr:single-stranded-DNA-specific exonuclease RecJ [Blautia ammoniilytica]MCU6766432.1 single-stranded-DNA-specific exonuclease RecJ [Blautia ammoniilytica]SCI59639.1 Single-stranded-DNA-specific exonuclease recJ [uncultured Blautia sp.]